MAQYNPASLLSARGLNTLLFSDPYSKLCFTSSLASSAKTAYIDLDTAFSAYLAAGKIQDARNVDVYLPAEGRFMGIFQQALEQVPRYSIVIVDSINSFYAVYYRHYKRDHRMGGSINHLLSVLLMLLVRQGVTHGVPVLATSMLRFRREGGWRQSPASRRLLQKKSVCKMQIEIGGGLGTGTGAGKAAETAGSGAVLRILEHDTLTPGSTYPVMPLH